MNDFNTNDPRLTAYALGELEESEREQLEAALAEREDLRAEVDAIKSVAGELRDEFMHEPTPALSGDQREAIRSQAASGLRLVGGGDRQIQPAWWWRIGISGAAAVLLLGVGLPLLNRGRSVDGNGLAIEDGGPAVLPGSRDASGAGEDFRMRQPAKPAGAEREQLLASSEAQLEELTRVKEELTKAARRVNAPETLDSTGAPAERAEYALQPPEIALHQQPTDSEATVLYMGGGAAPTARPSSPAVAEARHRLAARTGVTQWSDTPASSTGQGEGRVPNSIFDDVTDAPARGFVDDERLPRDLFVDPTTEQIATRDRFAPITDNPFFGVVDAPLSTFSIDVDTASYSMVRRQLRDGQRPAPDSVRLEEMINYFDYDYEAPSPGDAHPFRANVEVGACPWRPEHRLVRVGIKGMEIAHDNRPATNLVFLLDVSGSMKDRNKLPLVKEGFKQLVDHLTVDDRVAIVVYAGASGVVLDSTYVSDRQTILASLDNLQAGGSTNGGAGIELAYKIAQDHFIEGGVNRVILATDGDFNVGVTGDGDLFRLIEEKARSGVFLTTLGYGMGNLNDAMLEQLADKGNGMCAYIDTIEESQKVLIDQMSGSLVTIAKDVKIQVEFNPAQVRSYRLLGYENRVLAAQDFNDDTKDAGEIGAGHTVTALYEIEPVAPAMLANAEPEAIGFEGKSRSRGAADTVAAPAEQAAPSEDTSAEETDAPAVDPLRYQKPAELTDTARESGELLTVKLRYKQPDGEVSTLVEFPARDEGHAWEQASDDFRFASSVAAFGMILRESPYRGSATFSAVMDWARAGESTDPHGYRRAFVDMVNKAKQIMDPTAD